MNEYNFMFTNLILSLVLTWGIGLSWALLVRFLLVRRPLSKRTAMILTSVFWLLNLIIFEALGSQSKGHFALLFVAWASYHIMHKGYRLDNPSGRKDEHQQEKERTLGVQSQVAMQKEQSVVAEHASTMKIACGEEAKSVNVAHSQTTNAAKEQVKWLVLALLAVVFIAIIAVRFSKLPAATQADNRDVANEFGFVPLQQQRDLSTPSSRLVGHWKNGDELKQQTNERMKWVEVDGRRTLINNPDYTARIPSVDELLKQKDQRTMRTLQQQYNQANAAIEKESNDGLRALNNQYNIRLKAMHAKFKSERDPEKRSAIEKQMIDIRTQFTGKAQALKDKFFPARRDLKTAVDAEIQKIQRSVEQRNLRLQIIRQHIAEGRITDPAVALQAEYKLLGIDIPLSALRP